MNKNDDIKALKAEIKALKEESKKQAATIKELETKARQLRQLWLYTGMDLNESAEIELKYTKGRREGLTPLNEEKIQHGNEIAKCRPEYEKCVKDLMSGESPLKESHAKVKARELVAVLVEEKTGWLPDDKTVSKRFPAKEKLDLS